MSKALLLKDFLKVPGVIFDVRSPAEFSQGRIPGAVSLPLFTNEERVLVGTAYKHQGKDQAIDLGLKLVGPKLTDFTSKAKNLAPKGLAKVHCWRGGMRSEAMAWLLGFAGFNTVVLKGGYKIFRRWSLDQLAKEYSFIVLGGMTGSGKTGVLEALKAAGEQILDLESIANHRGSSYGMLGMGPQPSTEQFENDIAYQLASFDIDRPIWLEDESRRIGTCNIPPPLFNQMYKAPLLFIEVPLEERLERLAIDYGNEPLEELIAATMRISKHLGSQRTKEIIQAIQEGRLREAIAEVLKYYDAAYTYGLARRNQPIIKLLEHSLSASDWADKLIDTSNTFNQSVLSKVSS